MKHRMMRSTGTLGMFVAATTSLACSFTPPSSLIDAQALLESLRDQPATEVDTGTSSLLMPVAGLNVPGKLLVQRRRACSEQGRPGLFFPQAADIPGEFDEGTVIFNGSQATYVNGSRHVEMLGSAIIDVRTVDRRLHWNAVGALFDDNGDDYFKWCYFYTLVFWRRDALQVTVPAGPQENRMFGEFSAPATPLHAIAGSITAPSAGFGGPRAVLPRGYAMWFHNEDHHLLQAGFDFGAPLLSGNRISWTSRSLFKDDESSRRFSSAEIVDVLNGPGVTTWEPTVVSRFEASPFGHWVPEQVDFQLRPKASAGFGEGCIANQTDEIAKHYQVEVPFPYAVPMLTGWQLDQPCNDTDITKIGVYLENFSFTPYANGEGGFLRYTVVGRLTNGDEGRLSDLRHQDQRPRIPPGRRGAPRRPPGGGHLARLRALNRPRRRGATSPPL